MDTLINQRIPNNIYIFNVYMYILLKYLIVLSFRKNLHHN